MKMSFEMPQSFKLVKDRLVKEFPVSTIEGIDTKRAEDFLHSKGLNVKPYVIFDESKLRRVKDIVGNTNLLRSTFENGECGLYSPEMDLVLVRRDRPYEEKSGAIYTEGLLVHELAHASSMYQGYITDGKSGFYTPRVGFCLPQNKIPWGWTLEEGWADMNRANYVAINSSAEERKRVVDSLNFGDLNMDDTIGVTQKNGVVPLPVKYLYLTPEGYPKTKSSAFAAYALELVCLMNPSIEPLLIKARSSTEGLRELISEFEKVAPGLYKKFQDSSYTEDDFFDILLFVMKNVAGQDKSVQARGLLRDYWDNQLKEK